MQKKDFDAVVGAIKRAKNKTTAAIRELLRDRDAKAEAAALAGKRLTARGRVSALFDEGTFVEIGALVKRRATEFDSGAAVDSDDFEGVICGYGAVSGRLVYAFAQDYFRSKGAIGEAHARKICSLYEMAIKNGAPIVGIFDSSGAFILEGVSALAGYGKIMKAASKASGVIPQIAIVAGTCAGSCAAIASMFDIVILSEQNGKIYTNATSEKSDLSVVSVSVKDEISAIIEAKALLSILPDNNAVGTVRIDGARDPSVLVDVSVIENEGYDAHAVLSAITKNTYHELYADIAPEIICAIAPVGSIVSGIVATNPAVKDGALTSDAAIKAARFVTFCDAFNIPVVTLVDSAGLDTDNDSAYPYAAAIARLASAYAEAECPLVTVVTGRAYGAAYTVLGSKAIGADVTFALDTAKIGAMSAQSAVAFLWDDKFAGAKDPDVRRKELEAEWDETYGNATEAAMKGEIDDVIPSDELLARIAASLEMLSMKDASMPTKRRSNLPL